MTKLFTVILNSFQNPNTGRPDVRKARVQAVICEQSSRKNILLPCIGKDGMGFNQSNTRRLLPTPSPSLIREGSNIVSFFPLHSSLKQKNAFTLAEGATHVAWSNNQRKIAFTLAEVLITLGIIGVVAAMTMPALIQNHRNTVVETRLKKFYSVINQAVIMAENDYGDKIYWFEDLEGAQTDNEGNLIPGSSESEKWFNKYLAPYMEIIKTEELSDGTFIVYFPDGSALKQAQQSTSRDWFFYPSKAKDCIEKYGDRGGSGVCAFAFIFCPRVEGDINWQYHFNKGFEPYMYGWDGNRTSLYNGCKAGTSVDRHFCTALIQYDGWKISKDYPQRIRF